MADPKDVIKDIKHDPINAINAVLASRMSLDMLSNAIVYLTLQEGDTLNQAIKAAFDTFAGSQTQEVAKKEALGAAGAVWLTSFLMHVVPKLQEFHRSTAAPFEEFLSNLMREAYTRNDAGLEDPDDGASPWDQYKFDPNAPVH